MDFLSLLIITDTLGPTDGNYVPMMKKQNGKKELLTQIIFILVEIGSGKRNHR